MAAINIIDCTPSGGVIASTSSIVIRFTRTDNAYTNVRARLHKAATPYQTVDMTASTVLTSTTCTTTVDVAALIEGGTIEKGTTYTLDLTAYDELPSLYQWSRACTFAAYDLPTAAITAPTAGATLLGYPLAIEWTASDDTGISSTRIVVRDTTAGTTAYDGTVDGALRSVELGASDIALVNGHGYAATATVRNGVGLETSATVAFEENWTPPRIPTVTVDVDEDTLAATITAVAGEEADDWVVRFEGTNAIFRDGYFTLDGTDAVVDAPYTISGSNIQFAEMTEPVTVSMSVVRIGTDGSRTVIAEGLSSGDTATDHLPQLGVEYAYEVSAYAATGAMSTADVPTTIDTRCWALNYIDRGGEMHARTLRYNPQASYSLEQGGDSYHFADCGAGDGLPVWYGTPDRDESGTLAFDTVMNDDADWLRTACRTSPVMWLRDPFGHRWRARVRLSVSHGVGQIWHVSLNWEAVRFKEA